MKIYIKSSKSDTISNGNAILLPNYSGSLYFISEKDFNNTTLYPRVPKNFFTDNSYEDDFTPRISFAPSIKQCLAGLSQNVEGKTYYVYSPVSMSGLHIYKPNRKAVPDVDITGELWVTDPVEIKQVDKITVTGNEGRKGRSFTYGDNTAELYDDWTYVNSTTSIKASVNTSPENIAKTIQQYSDELSKDPTGNQNCMLCTWAAEQRFRGIDALPRPVYSPRDPIFNINPKKIVNNSVSIPNLDVKTLKAALDRSGDGCRYYVHVNWAGSSGGHEFLAINQNGKFYVLDAQSGIYALIDSPEGKEYFDDIEPKNSYAFRIDNKELNEELLKLNDDENLVEWDEEADVKYMEDNGMI